jgi:hypothetical protein
VLANQGKGAWPVCGRGLSGPTFRTLADDTTPETVAELNVITIADDVAVPDGDGVASATEDIISIGADTASGGATFLQVGFDRRVPQTPVPADPSLPPAAADPTPPPVAADPTPSPVASAPTPPVAAAAPEDDPLSTPTGTAVATAAPADGTAHLPSPDSLPPGTSAEPVGSQTNANVGYLKDLWQAIQNKQVDREDLLLALAQRSFTAPIPGDTESTAVLADGSDPTLLPVPDPALLPVPAPAAE